MINEIHPTIEKLKISKKAKVYFTKLEFFEILEDPIILSTFEKKIDESLKNLWSFKVDRKLKNFTKDDLKIFYEAIIEHRAEFLRKNYPEFKMIIYTWYDDMSGNFYFSLIPTSWERLPFGCKIKKVKYLDDIIQEFIDDPYKGVIPMAELIDLDPLTEEEDDEEFYNNYILNVWSIIIP